MVGGCYIVSISVVVVVGDWQREQNRTEHKLTFLLFSFLPGSKYISPM